MTPQRPMPGCTTRPTQLQVNSTATGRGMPHREPHASQVLARAYAAEPTSKTWLHTILMAAGQRPHIAGGAAVSDGAVRPLYRLVALLSREGCEKGDYRLAVCNGTLAHELGRTERSIRRYLSELQALRQSDLQ